MKDEKGSNKLFLTLEEISRIAQLDPAIIEGWEKEFYFLHAGKTASGQKIFRKKDLAIILRIKELLDKSGFTLAGAKRKIEEEFGIKTPTSAHPDRLKKLLFQTREQLQEIANSLGEGPKKT